MSNRNLKFNQLFPSKWLKETDLRADVTNVTIRDVWQETLQTQDGKVDDKPIIKFDEYDKSMICNKTNAQTLVDLFGDGSLNWIGKRVSLEVETVVVGGQRHRVIRIVRAKPDADLAPSVPDASDGSDGDIPFDL